MKQNLLLLTSFLALSLLSLSCENNSDAPAGSGGSGAGSEPTTQSPAGPITIAGGQLYLYISAPANTLSTEIDNVTVQLEFSEPLTNASANSPIIQAASGLCATNTLFLVKTGTQCIGATSMTKMSNKNFSFTFSGLAYSTTYDIIPTSLIESSVGSLVAASYRFTTKPKPFSCAGTHTPCSLNNYPTQSACAAQVTCNWTPAVSGVCSLNLTLCTSFSGSITACQRVAGCSFNSMTGMCAGIPSYPCSTITDQPSCAEVGPSGAGVCTWTGGSSAFCTGTVQPCSTFTTQSVCTSQTGCLWQ